MGHQPNKQNLILGFAFTTIQGYKAVLIKHTSQMLQHSLSWSAIDTIMGNVSKTAMYVVHSCFGHFLNSQWSGFIWVFCLLSHPFIYVDCFFIVFFFFCPFCTWPQICKCYQAFWVSITHQKIMIRTLMLNSSHSLNVREQTCAYPAM